MGGGQGGGVPENPDPVSIPDKGGEEDPPPEMDAKEEAASEPDEDQHQGDGIRTPSPSEEGDMADQQPLEEPMGPPPAAPEDGGAGNANLQNPRPRVRSEPLIDRDILRRAVQFQGNYDEIARRGRRRGNGSSRPEQ